MTQADNITPTPAVQPAATTAVTVVTQPDIFTGTITLKAEEAYAMMTKVGELREYSADSKMAGKSFNLFRYGGAAFPCSEEFTDLFSKREIVSVTLTGRRFERNVPDPLNAGETKLEINQSYSLDAFLSLAEYKLGKLASLRIKSIDLDIQRAEKAMETRASKDLSTEMTDAELDKLLALA